MSASASPLPFSFHHWKAERLRREQRREARLWGFSLLGVSAIGGGVLGWLLLLPAPTAPMQDAAPPAIAMDLAPSPLSIPAPPTDAPPGPQQTLSQPDPAPELPPEVSAPPAPAPNPPVPVPMPEKLHKIVKKHTPAPRLPTPAPDLRKTAEQTTAPPAFAAAPASTQAAPPPGLASAQNTHEPATWQGLLLGRLEKYKRYPAQAQANAQQGTALLTFTMDRKGRVLSARLAGSSGHALLDAETLALVHRAEPLPSPPESVQGERITLTVPVEFDLKQNSD
ncbi:energy transducer TonB family protein [Acetobacter fabarum]|uniref:energy transducer TonB family protein n=1 Tax=Acetobacter fabarum TaxID=483199 RepID=UPI0039E79317